MGGAHRLIGDDGPDDHEGTPHMLTAAFWLGATDRAVKSYAQALLLLWGSDEVFNILEIDIVPALGVGAGAAALSLLTSIVSAPVGDKGSTALLPGAS
jgi:hypothetical protein